MRTAAPAGLEEVLGDHYTPCLVKATLEATLPAPPDLDTNVTVSEVAKRFDGRGLAYDDDYRKLAGAPPLSGRRTYHRFLGYPTVLQEESLAMEAVKSADGGARFRYEDY